MSMQDEAEDFAEMALGPLAERYERGLTSLKEQEDLEQFLKVTKPRSLISSLEMGFEQATARYEHILSARTQRALEDIHGQSSKIARKMKPLWNEIDEYDRKGLLQGAAAGIFSGEAATGAAIGSVIAPGIGTAIGSSIGGFFAGKKIDDQFERNFEEYCELLDGFYTVPVQRFENQVIPRFEEDLRDARTIEADNHEALPQKNRQIPTWLYMLAGLILISLGILGGLMI